MIQNVHQSTHISGNTIDLIITEPFSDTQINNIEVKEFHSDHGLIIGDINRELNQMKKIHLKFRNYKYTDFSNLIENLNLENQATSTGDINDLIAKFSDTSVLVLNLHAPYKEVKKDIIERKPWYTDLLFRLRKDLRHCFRNWFANKLAESWQKFIRIRNKYWYETDKAKRSYMNDQISLNKNDSKKLFKLVSTLIGVKEENPLPTGYTDTELSENFAGFFVMKIQNIRTSLQSYPKLEPTTSTCPNSLNSFNTCTTKEISKILSKMEFKTCELDPLPTWIIQQHREDFLEFLCTLCNRSLQSGIFPDSWKTAILRPLLKKPNLDHIFRNYRPVSNHSFFFQTSGEGGYATNTKFL